MSEGIPKVSLNELGFFIMDANNGRIITYCRAAAIRASLQRAGLNIKTITPKDKNSKHWSYGTVGIKNGDIKTLSSEIEFCSNLSAMEQDHLNCVAATPYRDPSGESTRDAIIKRRNIEQNKSTYIFWYDLDENQTEKFLSNSKKLCDENLDLSIYSKSGAYE